MFNKCSRMCHFGLVQLVIQSVLVFCQIGEPGPRVLLFLFVFFLLFVFSVGSPAPLLLPPL